MKKEFSALLVLEHSLSILINLSENNHIKIFIPNELSLIKFDLETHIDTSKTEIQWSRRFVIIIFQIRMSLTWLFQLYNIYLPSEFSHCGLWFFTSVVGVELQNGFYEILNLV